MFNIEILVYIVQYFRVATYISVDILQSKVSVLSPGGTVFMKTKLSDSLTTDHNNSICK